MPSVNNVKLTIGGAETTAGTAVSREYVLPVRSLPALNKTVERAPDPAIVGRNMDAGGFAVADNVAGTIPLSIRPCGGVGQVFKSLLGTEESPTTFGSAVRIRYTGSSASAKLVMTSGTAIRSLIGTLGSESADANFGTAGVITVYNASYDLVSEFVSAVNGYSQYTCAKVAGLDNSSIGTAVSDIRQGKNTWAWFFPNGSAGAYRHTFTPDLGSTERPTYTLQYDGRQGNQIYDGVVINSLTITAALKGMVEADADILGFDETSTATSSTLTLEDIDPLIFHDGSFTIGANEYTYIRNVSLTIMNNHNAEGYGQGDISRLYHQKGKFEVTGQAQVRLDATSFAERTKVTSGDTAAISLYFKGEDIDTDRPYMMIVEIPYCTIEDFAFQENAGVIDATISFKATYPKGTVYNDPFAVHLITDDSAAY